jgi:phage terminase large subunit-like protein
VSPIAVWERPERASNWKVPRDEVDDAVAEAMERFDVAELAADPLGWIAELEGWRDAYGDTVIDFPTSSRQRMAVACDRFRVAVLEGDLRHDGSALLARHIGHCVTRPTPHGVIITKEHPDSPHKIDCAIAAVISFERASWHRMNTEEDKPILVAVV